MPANRVTSKSPWHVVLVLDDSGSMSGAPADNVNDAVGAMIEEMKILSAGSKPYFKVSIVRFGSQAETLCTAASEQDIDVDRVTNLSGDSGSTNAAAALEEVTNLLRYNGGEPTDFTPYVFFLSDGEPDDAGEALEAANNLKALSIPAGNPRLVTIGFGSVNDGFMRSLATNPELYKKLKDSREAVRLFPQIGTVAASQTGIQAVDTAIVNI